MSSIFEWANRHGVGAEAIMQLMDLLDPSRGDMVLGDGTSEAAVQAELRVRAARLGCALWRNNRGAMQNPEGQFVRFGLGNDSEKLNAEWKSSDLIGIIPQRIDPKHVGEVWGVFAAIEVKSPGWNGPKNDRERAQGRFLSTVKAMGGIARFAQDVKDVFR